MYYTILRTRVLPCTLRRSVFFSRAHHSATGRFITISSQGAPVTRDIEVWLGDPGSAYVMFDPEISRAFKTDETILQGGCSLAQVDQDLYPLNFYHDTRHFSHSKKLDGCNVASKMDLIAYYSESSPYPRLEIPQDLPRQSNANSSLATLHTYGVTHAITLDEMPDGKPAQCV